MTGPPQVREVADQFPKRVDQINADRDVRLAVHLGDIKSGSTVCSDEYFASIRAEFDRFRDPHRPSTTPQSHSGSSK